MKEPLGSTHQENFFSMYILFSSSRTSSPSPSHQPLKSSYFHQKSSSNSSPHFFKKPKEIWNFSTQESKIKNSSKGNQDHFFRLKRNELFTQALTLNISNLQQFFKKGNLQNFRIKTSKFYKVKFQLKFITQEKCSRRELMWVFSSTKKNQGN